MRTRAKKKHAYFQMDWNFDQSTEQFEINLIFRKDFFMDQSYMKKQPVLGLVVKMSLPMVISMLVNSLYNIVDSLFVAKISENAMTALSLVFPLQNLIGAIMIAPIRFWRGKTRERAVMAFSLIFATNKLSTIL